MKAAPNNRRKFGYFVKKEFQLNMIYQFWLLLIVSAILAGIALFFVAGSMPLKQFILSKMPPMDFSGKMSFYTIMSLGLMSIVLVGSAAFVIIIYYARRVAGPLFSVERSLKEIGDQGDLSRKIKIRTGDESQIRELVDALNDALDKIESRVYSIKVRADQLNNQIEQLRDCQTAEELKSSLEDVYLLKDDLNRAIQSVKLKINL